MSNIDRESSVLNGRLKIIHICAIMYSYWDAAPNGPSVFQVAAQQLRDDLQPAFRQECAAWGTQRLNAPLGEALYIIEDAEAGSIVADHTMTKFYRVLGMKLSPATAMRNSGIPLPQPVRLTALPFRGLLEYDANISAAPGVSLSPKQKETLINRCRAAKEAGKVLTTFCTPPPPPAKSPVSVQSIHTMSTAQLKKFIKDNGGSVSECIDKSDLVSRALSFCDKATQ